MNFFGFGKRPPSNSAASSAKDFQFEAHNFLTVSLRMTKENNPTILVNSKGDYLPR